MKVSFLLVLTTTKKHEKKKIKKEKRKKPMNQVRLHFHSASRTNDVGYVVIEYTIYFRCAFAHLMPSLVRLSFRFAQLGSLRLPSLFIDFLLICSLHISYVREFLGGLRTLMLIGFQRGSMC